MLAVILLCVSLLGVAQCSPIEVTISTSEWYRLGEEIECEVTITNTLDKDLLLYHRNTPLEGLKSDIFAVTHKTSKVRYDGILFKRVDIDKIEESTLLKAKSSLQAKVDLSLAYSIMQAGFYSVQLSSTIYYQAKSGNITGQHLASPPASFDILPSEGTQRRLTAGEKQRINQKNFKVSTKEFSPSATVKDPLFLGDGDSVDKTTAKKAWEGAYSIIVSSPAVVDKAEVQYTTWFGAKDEGRQDTVKGMFERIQKAMEDTEFTLYFHGQDCEGDTFAYTYHDSPYIYLCEGYFRAEDTHDLNSKLGTFIHQLTINVGETKEFPRTDEPEECQNLAKDRPLDAIRSAYNYEYFCETL